MQVELRKVSINKRLSEETTCFSAELWINGAKAGTAANRGHGGDNEIHITDRALAAQFYQFCRDQPPLPPEPPINLPLTMDADLYVSLLLETWEERQSLKRRAKTTTFFRLRDETYKPGEWHSVKRPYSPQLRQQLLTKYGDNLQEIANDSFAAPVQLAHT